jgi:hypothetical protein
MVGRRFAEPEPRLTFLSIFGPLSVMLLLMLWGAVVIVAFALIYYGLGSQFQAVDGPVNFGTLLYMSGSTFLTLGLGDISSPHPFDRLLIIAEAATGYVFLSLIITYMPLLDQAYAAREVGSLLIGSRAGSPPGAIRLLHRYTRAEHDDILRGNLREAERWMAETIQSHLSHPVVSFYRAQHFGQSWLVSLTTMLDTCALLIVSGRGLPREQARLTYGMGLRLLADLARALGVPVAPPVRWRLTADDLPNLRAALDAAGIPLTLGPDEGATLLLLSQRYDVYLHALSSWLMISLPGWISPTGVGLAETVSDKRVASDPIGV